jgi:hypothetical protein
MDCQDESRRRGACSIDRANPIGSLMASRRFPAPWSVEDIGAAFVVKDGSGKKLGVTRGLYVWNLIRLRVTSVTAAR